MPLPTQRRSRFLYRKAKNLRRSNYAYTHGWKYERIGGISRRVRRNWWLPLGGKQGPLDLAHSADKHGQPDIPNPLVMQVVIDPAGQHVPPVVHLTGSLPDANRLENVHFTDFHAGYANRRAGWRPRKVGRMNGMTRLAWASGLNAWLRGWFFDNDPYARHPNATDMENGSPAYSGPFPGPHPLP